MKLLLALLLAAGAVRASAAEQTLTGTFDWNGQANKKHAITAVFTPDGPGKWKVKFDCAWGGKPQTFVGTATGNLTHNSDIQGEASLGKRTWKFQGQVVQKELSVRHSETTGGKEQPTGRMTLAIK